ncbi:MAG TPA: MMPL family transporter, partial [Euzebya sp.]|nr:MMPL family transporter [Euzebya sp.]
LTPAVHNAMVRAGDDLAEVDGVVTFGEAAAASSPVSVLGQVLASLAPEGDAAPPGAGLAQPVDAALGGQITALLDPQSLTVPADADVDQLYDLLLQAAPAEAGQVIAADADVARFIIQTDAGEHGAGDLADDLTVAFQPVSDALGTDGSAVVTSDGIVATRITDSLRDSQLRSLFIAVLAAMVLLVISFWISDRRPMLGFITIAPVALVVLWTFGMMAATGVPVGPVTATIAALAVGIGVPYTIHVSNRWSEDRMLLATPEQAIRATVRHTGGALAGSAFTTMAGFGILVTSSLTPFQQFGLVTVYSIGFAMVAATVVLPSMLILYDRALRRRGDDPAADLVADVADRHADHLEPPAPSEPSTTR